MGEATRSGFGRCQGDTIVTGSSIRMPESRDFYTAHTIGRFPHKSSIEIPQIRTRERRSVKSFGF